MKGLFLRYKPTSLLSEDPDPIISFPLHGYDPGLLVVSEEDIAFGKGKFFEVHDLPSSLSSDAMPYPFKLYETEEVSGVLLPGERLYHGEFLKKRAPEQRFAAGFMSLGRVELGRDQRIESKNKESFP
jgi:hypothetical protein